MRPAGSSAKAKPAAAGARRLRAQQACQTPQIGRDPWNLVLQVRQKGPMRGWRSSSDTSRPLIHLGVAAARSEDAM